MLEPLAAAVRGVGERLLLWRREGRGRGAWVGSQFKAEADTLAHDALAAALSTVGGGLPVISEEDSASLVAERPPRYWLIDPIDGTASYAQGFDGFVTQAALMDAAGPVACAIHAPALGLLYTAGRNEGAWCNGTKLVCRRTPGRLVLIDNHPKPRGIAKDAFSRFGATGYVESGSIALKIARVADGTADLFIKDVAARDWDLGPPHLLLNEAGGVLLTLAGEPPAYRGSYEHRGLVAAVDAALAEAVVSWQRERAGAAAVQP